MKNTITISILLIFLSGSISVNAQKKQMSKADANYEQLDYVDAQKIYLAVAEKGYESEELFTKLGNSYYFNAQYDEAAKWYGRLFDLNPEPEQTIIVLRYSQSLKAIGNNEKAKDLYNSYAAASPTDANIKSVIDYQALIQQNSGRYDLQALEAIYNENEIAFGQTKVGGKLVYASTQETKTFLNKRSAWDGLSFLSLYELELDSLNIATGKPKKLKGELESKFHESSPTFTQDGKTMYFTRSNITYADKKNDQKLKIYRTYKKDGKWRQPEELNFNSDTYSSAHPTLNSNESKLYFSSDRPGGYGASDLYVATIDAEGIIGEPVNLGPKINTPGKETFPFVSENNELYFSSDGHFGLGGLDVFYVKIKDDGFGNLLNVGEPINSNADDFAFGINDRTRRGFISSNRSETVGAFVYDNIYSFLETAPIQDMYMASITGFVTDKQTGLPLVNTRIILTDTAGKVYGQTNTDDKGYYESELNKSESYFVKAMDEGYDMDEKVSKANLETQQINFELQQNRVPITEGTDLAKVLNIPIIYFDFDKSDIRKDAQVELEKLLAALNTYPQLNLNIRAHTDSRGNDAYNKLLSERRAKATLNYLVSNGIDKKRLQSEGLGETELVNKCSNGVPCSVEEHQKNRRSEFIIIDKN